MTKNAIERRIDQLAELWNDAAADPAMRVMCWRCDLDERRMLGVFAELEAEDAAQTPGTFIKLTTPFTSIRDYADTLIAELEAQYEASREGLRENGLPSEWQAPVRLPDESAGRHLLRVADTLRAAHANQIELLILFLVPTTVEDDAGWGQWLERLATAEIPAGLRVMVTDPIEAPLLDNLKAIAPGRVVTIEPHLDMPAALDELARSEGEEGPGKTFRIHLVSLANAAGARNSKLAERSATQALDVARKENWPDQEVVVHMALGSSRLAATEIDAAVRSYRSAMLAARRAAEAKHPAAGKLELSAGMGLGGALLAGARWAEAAKVYEACAPLAVAAPDDTMTLEAWRMAAHCHEQAGTDPEAWRCARHAIEAGEALPADRWQTSTLPWVGRTLLRLLERHYHDERHAAALRARMDGLLGAGWEERLDAEGRAA